MNATKEQIKEYKFLIKRKKQLHAEVDRLRTINPWYPIGSHTGKIGAIVRKLKVIEKQTNINHTDKLYL